MPDLKLTRVAIGRQDHQAVIKLRGRCTMSIATGLRKCLSLCRQPEITDLYFDLSEAEHLDSTCIGLVISLAFKKNDPAVPRVHLFHPTSCVTSVLEAMHVLEHLHRCDALPATITTWEEVPIDDVDRRETADAVIQAHEQLIAADPRNEGDCRPVVEGLKAYQRDHSAGKG